MRRGAGVGAQLGGTTGGHMKGLYHRGRRGTVAGAHTSKKLLSAAQALRQSAPSRLMGLTGAALLSASPRPPWDISNQQALAFLFQVMT